SAKSISISVSFLDFGLVGKLPSNWKQKKLVFQSDAGVERSTCCVARNAIVLLGFWSAHGVRRGQGCVACS
ncbi:hypothetical protein A2U01_0032814, partial [Trifolium medium]|nr:hypothetical protein [Trifolium medium]